MTTDEHGRTRHSGLLITFEGMDGTGKTTACQAVFAALKADGLPVVMLREPGGVKLAEDLRVIIKDPSRDIDDRAESLLFAAARAQMVAESVRPALNRGDIVLLDRYIDSTLAYQGGGRGLDIDALRRLNVFAAGGLMPDRTLLLRAPFDVRAARIHGDDTRGGSDRIEGQDREFFAAVDLAYDALARAEPDRIHPIEAAGNPDEVAAACLADIADLLAVAPVVCRD